MPGLFGFANLQTCPSGDHFLENMMHSLKHLDEYHAQYACRKNAGAGVVSLTRSRCIQKNDNIFAVCYGDIYDVIDDCDRKLLSDGRIDAAAVIRLFHEYGEQLPEKLNGSFNIFLHDDENNISYLFNDRFGNKPLYFYQDANIFAFAPEIKAFLTYDKFDKILDPHGLSDYFVYFYQFSDRTFFKNVKLLPPASMLRIKRGEVSVKTYWTAVYSTSKFQKDIKDAVKEGYRLFEQSVDRCLGDSKKILVPLSGGLDSRLIMSVAGRREVELNTVTFGAKKCLDHRLARRVCKTMNKPSPQLIEIHPDWLQKYANALAHFGECSYGALGLTTQHAIPQSLSGTFDVTLNGIYGGHLSFGSPYYSKADLTTVYSEKERIERIRRGFNGHRFFEYMKKNVVTAEVRAMVDEYADETIAQEWQRSSHASDQYVFRQDYIFIYNRIRRGMNNINQNVFYFNDKQPFASYELFDFYLTLSSELASEHFLYKEMYKEFLPDLAQIPWQQTGKNLYDQSLQLVDLKRTLKRYLSWYLTKFSNGKFSFFDHDQYENQDIVYRQNVQLRKWVESVLLSDRCLGRGFFSKEGVTCILQRQAKGQNMFPEIGKMILFELWAREFIDGDGVGIGK